MSATINGNFCPTFLKNGGQMGIAFRNYSWSETSLGDISKWPNELKTILNMALNSNFPSIVIWGYERHCFYNDAYCKLMNNSDLLAFFGRPLKGEVYNKLFLMKEKVDAILGGDEFKQRDEICITLFSAIDQKTLHWPMHYNAIYEDDNKSGVLISCAEIAEFENNIYKLNIIDKQFQNLIHQASVGIIVLIGIEMRVEVVNEMYSKLIGRTVDELEGKLLFDVIPEAEAYFRPIIESVRKTGNPIFLYDTPYTVMVGIDQKKEGFLNLVYQPYVGSNGKISGVMVLCHDVTEQVGAKKTIIAAEEKARMAIESADLGTYEIDMITNEMVTSDRFNKILGVGKGMTRSEFATLVHKDDLLVGQKAHEESLESGYLHYEARVIWKDGEYHWIRIKGKLLYDELRKPLKVLGTIQDITDQKKFTDNLSRLVQERTEELQATNEELVATNEELIEANTHFIRANRELEQFAYVSSHDLQEPLRKIQVFTNILHQRYSAELTPDAYIYLEKISSSANRMSSLIKDLLDYSRLSYNSSLFKEVDLNGILQHVITDYELLIQQKNIEVIADHLYTLNAIPIQMNQLFYNLVGNAIKFSKKNSKSTITISSRLLSCEDVRTYTTLKENQRYQEIKIIDNGIGFSQQYAEQIFTIFQRLNDKSKYGGYGIGLALCKRIVENHSGIIYAKGIENEGATFVFILPIKHNQS